MEVRGQQPGGADEARQRFKQMQSELSSAIRDRATGQADEGTIERTNEAARADAAQPDKPTERARAEAKTSVPEPDRVELSKAARALSGQADKVREAHMQELRTAHRDGGLNTPERISKAADRLLGG